MAILVVEKILKSFNCLKMIKYGWHVCNDLWLARYRFGLINFDQFTSITIIVMNIDAVLVNLFIIISLIVGFFTPVLAGDISLESEYYGLGGFSFTAYQAL